MKDVSSKYTRLDLSRLKQKTLCLTADIEQDYGCLLGRAAYEAIEHLPEVAEQLKQHNLPLTCFIQGSLYDDFPERLAPLRQIEAECELHSYSHPKPSAADLAVELVKGIAAYRHYFGRAPMGYRSPLGGIKDAELRVLKEHGFSYDSSVFPSFRPGVFNNLGKPITPFVDNASGMVEFPFSTLSNMIRIPLAPSYIRLSGGLLIRAVKMMPLSPLVLFNFHLHDLFPLDSWRHVPWPELPLWYRGVARHIYRSGRGNGLGVVLDFAALMRRKGYRLARLSEVYAEISDGAVA